MSYKDIMTATPQSSEPTMAPFRCEQDLLDAKYLTHLSLGRYPSDSLYEFLWIHYSHQEIEHITLIEQDRNMLDRLSDNGFILPTPYGAKLTAQGRRYLTALR